MLDKYFLILQHVEYCLPRAWCGDITNIQHREYKKTSPLYLLIPEYKKIMTVFKDLVKTFENQDCCSIYVFSLKLLHIRRCLQMCVKLSYRPLMVKITNESSQFSIHTQTSEELSHCCQAYFITARRAHTPELAALALDHPLLRLSTLLVRLFGLLTVGTYLEIWLTKFSSILTEGLCGGVLVPSRHWAA